MTFQHGDRVRWDTTGDDGLPLVRYGFVGPGEAGDAVTVLLDGELRGDVVDPAQLVEVSMTTVCLSLGGRDLLGDTALRRGLVGLWAAEAESAGLDIDALQRFGDGWLDGHGRWVLAEVHSAGERYLVRAALSPDDDQVVCVRATSA